MIARVLTLAVMAFVTAGPARAEDATQPPVKVPFEMLQKGRLISGHLAVQVKINGKGPYRLVFDGRPDGPARAAVSARTRDSPATSGRPAPPGSPIPARCGSANWKSAP